MGEPAKVLQKGKITIPADIRQNLGINEGKRALSLRSTILFSHSQSTSTHTKQQPNLHRDVKPKKTTTTRNQITQMSFNSNSLSLRPGDKYIERGGYAQAESQIKV